MTTMLEVLMSVLGVATIVALVKDNGPLAAGLFLAACITAAVAGLFGVCLGVCQ